MPLDAISEARLLAVHPVLADRVRQQAKILEPQGVPFRVIQGLRSWATQAGLFAKGRTVPGEPCQHNGVLVPLGSCQAHPLGVIVTKAPPGYGYHEYGLAVDNAPDDPTKPGYQPDWDASHLSYVKMISAGQSVGLAPGGLWRTFPDAPHFQPQELPVTPTDEMRQLLKDGGHLAVWESIKFS